MASLPPHKSCPGRFRKDLSASSSDNLPASFHPRDEFNFWVAGCFFFRAFCSSRFLDSNWPTCLRKICAYEFNLL